MTLHININDEAQVEAFYCACKHAKTQKLTPAQAEAFLLDLLRQIRTDDGETQADYERARDQQEWVW